MKKDLFENGIIFWTTAQAFIYHYLPDIRKTSVNTVSSYRDGLNAYVDYLAQTKNIQRKKICFNDFSKKQLNEYLDWMLNVRSLSPKTCNLRMTAINSFLKYASDEHTELTAIYVSVCDIKTVKVAKMPIEFFEKKQMKALLAAPDIYKKTGRRNQMILIMLYDTAIRVSELLELSVKNLHLDADVPYVTIHGKGNKYRNVPIMSKTREHLRHYLKEFHYAVSDDTPLFYTVTHGIKHRLSPDTIEKLIKNSAAKARCTGVDMPESSHCHMIRKTRAMDLYQAGIPLAHIQQLLGHEDISTTSGFYAFATVETLSKSMSKISSSIIEETKNWKEPKTLARLYSL